MITDDVQSVLVNTGNLLVSEQFKRKAILAPSAELLEGLQLTLEHWSKSVADNTRDEDEKKLPDGTLLIRNKHLEPPKVSEASINRQDMKVSVKMFAFSESCRVFTSAINIVMEQLGLDWIDSLTLSLPPAQMQGSIELMKPIWSCAVKNVREGKVHELGVSDLNTDQLKELYDWAEEIKPTTNQINLESCCVIPPEMNEFAQTKDIRLLTHNDPRDFLLIDRLQAMLEANGFPNPEEWKRLWVARYTIMVTGKGIIQTKGYLLAIVKRQ